MRVLIDKKAPGVTAESLPFRVDSNTALVADGLAGAEVIPLRILVNGNWVQAKDGAGAVINLTATISQINIVGAGLYSITVPTTAGVVSVACG